MNSFTRRTLLAGGGVIGIAALGAGGIAGRNWLRDREPPSPPLRDPQGHLLWRNWSGIAHSYPAVRAAPASEDELLALLASSRAPVRAVGAGHSFTALVSTDGTLLSLDALSGVLAHDAASNSATVGGGTRLADLGPALAAIGQEMINLPDINKQSVGGVIATATHGTGIDIQAVHGAVTAFRLATPTGQLLDCSPDRNADIYQAARVGLGAFGIVTQVTLQNQPIHRILKRTSAVPTEQLIAEWPRLRQQHRNAEFFAWPFVGWSTLITHDVTDRPVSPRGADEDTSALMGIKRMRDWFDLVPPLRRRLLAAEFARIQPEEFVDEGWKLLSNERPVRFNEMEYHLPIEVQMQALREVLAAIENHRPDVFFPIEVRSIAADDAWLSPFYQRRSGSVAVHAFYRDDHQFFFELIEPIFRRHGGRPHWGKLHSLQVRELAALYPRWADAMAIRHALDPEGRMLNDYLKGVLIDG